MAFQLTQLAGPGYCKSRRGKESKRTNEGLSCQRSTVTFPQRRPLKLCSWRGASVCLGHGVRLRKRHCGARFKSLDRLMRIQPKVLNGRGVIREAKFSGEVGPLTEFETAPKGFEALRQ